MPNPNDQRQPSAALVHKLREANQNLVIASLKAQDLQDQAEMAVERQTEFLSMLAHELRNPLAPIAMAADLLKSISAAHPQLPNIHQIIARQVSSMKRLLEDLLDASRVSSGKITLRKSPLLLTDLVRVAVEISQPLLNKNRQQLTLDLPERPVVVDGDAVRLSQVFSNLLINASKYSLPGSPIGLSACHQADGSLAIRVTDRGVGIEPDIQPFIFDLFTQAPRTLERSEGGLGIGLAMVRSLVEMHGGTVHVRSEGLGCGSEFTVLLPVSADQSVAPEAIVAVSADSARPCRILVVEDNADANETLNFCLRLDGHTVDSAFDGPAGLAMAVNGHYDLVVCDIGLPGMDGYEVLRQMRLLRLSSMPCCIAMTGYDQRDFRAHALEVGFDHYLVKPVSMGVLQSIISKAFPQQP
ncbi:MAG: putative signal transduction histidine kinase [Polaromonas sp.]|nr:putative signal transduction histidine kinase [Polaromonas sp.]